jgi:hypothetical protein
MSFDFQPEEMVNTREILLPLEKTEFLSMTFLGHSESCQGELNKPCLVAQP